MSRNGGQRALTLTEELERLEQQITLTLQQIDQNFSKAHQIVTSAILPVVEEYAKHSNDVWESSKFWKQFFEAAANVSLSGYEEAALDDETVTSVEHTATDVTTPEQHHLQHAHSDDDYTVESPTQISGTQSTPKLNSSGPRTAPQPARSPSPRKYTGKNPLAQEETSTPNAQSSRFSSPFQLESAFKPASAKRADNVDPVLHRSVLDKNYRVLSTPFRHRAQAQQAAAGAAATPATAKKQPWEDSLDSSPEMAAPQLRSDLFSPARQSAARPGPRTPGVSVQKPAKNREGVPVTSTGRKLFGEDDKAMHTDEQRPLYYFSKFDSDEEDEDSLGMSPPKTLQFHVPQSRLIQTPAREASKRIVEDLLATAGMADDTTSDFDASPSMIRGRSDEDDTF